MLAQSLPRTWPHCRLLVDSRPGLLRQLNLKACRPCCRYQAGVWRGAAWLAEHQWLAQFCGFGVVSALLQLFAAGYLSRSRLIVRHVAGLRTAREARCLTHQVQGGRLFAEPRGTLCTRSIARPKHVLLIIPPDHSLSMMFHDVNV